MSEPTQKTAFIDYYPAELHETKRWEIVYYVKHPQTNVMTRKVIRVNKIKNINERRKYAKQLVANINDKLRMGWNPFIEQSASKSYHKLIDAMDTFLNYKTKELRKDSIRTYKSYINALKQFIVEQLKQKDIYVIAFDRVKAISFLDYVYQTLDVTESKYNSYLGFCINLWNWLQEREYCNSNVFQGIRRKREQETEKSLIDNQWRKKIHDYLTETGEEEFLLYCNLIYYTFIRPKELGMLRREDFDTDKQIIIIKSEVSKMRKARVATIPDAIMTPLKKVLARCNDNNYVFSDDFKPGNKPLDSRYAGKRWTKLRSEIGMPKEMQLYSLKHTGIGDLLREGTDIITVRDQAGHSSVEMTNVYLKRNKTASEIIKNKKTGF